MKDIAFICGAPRSGTTLLTNLLDGHRSIFMLPWETHILQYWNFHRHNNSLESFFTRDYLNTDDILFFISKNARESHGRYLYKVYGNKDHFKFKVADKKTFIEQYLGTIANNGITLKSIYEAVFNAAMQSEGASEERLAIEKRPLDNEICAILLHQSFPDAKFIHIIRDPRTRYLSDKMRRVYRTFGILPKYAGRLNGKSFAVAHSEISMVSMELALLNKEILKEKYLIVLYEELLKNPKKVMNEVAQHLGIDYTESLLNQTSVNQKQTALSSIQKGMTSGIKDITDERLKAFYTNTSRLERIIVRLFTWEVAKHFHYDIKPIDYIKLRDIIQPIKFEDPRHYFKNRIYMLRNLRTNSLYIKNRHFHNILNKFYQGVPL